MRRGGSLALLVAAEVAAMSLWFSASAVVPALAQDLTLSPTRLALFTSAVQAGFVVGTVISALLLLADRVDARRLFALSALVAAIANGGLLILPMDGAMVIVLRFLTGLCMAGVYPVGMRIAASWARTDGGSDMGLLVGLLVAALTLGSATPHLLNGLGGLDWRFTIAGGSVLALAAAVMVTGVAMGPNTSRSPPFNPSHALAGFRQPALRLANLGYLGHMWELYAMWAFVVLFLEASFAMQLPPAVAAAWAPMAAFAAIGIGGVVGCLAGGWLADRAGRTLVTSLAMSASALCAVATALVFGLAPWLVFALVLLWGVAVIADSAQFSASVAELSDPRLVGTMLTVQTSAGFLLTLVTIHLMPLLVEAVGWRFAFVALAPGPILGVWAMLSLRRRPEAGCLAGGRR
ncbi:MAG: MFS transporter [Alphaproteobacteria bacterium]